MALFSCNINSLIQSSKCLSAACMADPDRSAIDIYVRVANLAASGGTDYRNNLTKLLKDSVQWQKSAETLRAVSLWMDILNANDNGAGLSTNPKVLLSAARCMRASCLGKEQTRGIKEFLKCSINAQGKPD